MSVRKRGNEEWGERAERGEKRVKGEIRLTGVIRASLGARDEGGGQWRGFRFDPPPQPIKYKMSSVQYQLFSLSYSA